MGCRQTNPSLLALLLLYVCCPKMAGFKEYGLKNVTLCIGTATIGLREQLECSQINSNSYHLLNDYLVYLLKKITIKKHRKKSVSLSPRTTGTRWLNP
jgi:hypothetical protein